MLLILIAVAWGCSDDDTGLIQTATFSVTYEANGALSGSVPADTNSYPAGSAVTVADNTGSLTKTGYSFAGWNSAADGNGTNYAAGETLTIPATNVTLYAQWSINQYTVTFDSQGADTAADPGTVSVDYNTTVSSLPTEPVKAEYVFSGWYTAQNGGGSEFTESTAVTADVTVYAWWKHVLAVIPYRDMVTVSNGWFTQTDTSGNSFNHTISSFQIGKYEVTYELWYTVYSWATNNGYTFANPGTEGHDGTAGAAPTTAKYQPVTTVNWRDAIIWCNAYSQMAGYTPVYYSDSGYTTPLKDSSSDGYYSSNNNNTAGSYDNPYVNWSADGYRLPTEGEWLYAASYQDGTNWTSYNYASGATADFLHAAATCAVAWYDDNSGSTTHDVGTKTANRLGIHDMSGNVSEWCWDWYGTWPTDWQGNYRGPVSGTSFYGRVLRGGSYCSYDVSIRIGERKSSSSYYEYGVIGFRILSRPWFCFRISAQPGIQ